MMPLERIKSVAQCLGLEVKTCLFIMAPDASGSDNLLSD